MQIIPLHLAVEGMVLAREVCRNNNLPSVPVCGKYVILTTDLIRRFELMGVKSIYVKERQAVQEGDLTLEAMLEDLDCRFEKVSMDPLMMKVHAIYGALIKRSMGDDSGR